MKNQPKVVLVTGASSGIGHATAKHLSGLGHIVYGTYISPELSFTNDQFRTLCLDITKPQDVDNCIDQIIKQQDRIDVVVNNAGFGIAGAIEDCSDEDIYNQFNVNFFGLCRVCRKVLPFMRTQGSGKIINIGSIAGLFTVPYQSFYSASKGAIDVYTQALKLEVRHYNIQVTSVAPGDTRTDFPKNRVFSKNALNSVYSERMKKSIKNMKHEELNGYDPKKIAVMIGRLINKKRLPVRVVAGLFNKFLYFSKRYLPDSVLSSILALTFDS